MILRSRDFRGICIEIIWKNPRKNYFLKSELSYTSSPNVLDITIFGQFRDLPTLGTRQYSWQYGTLGKYRIYFINTGKMSVLHCKYWDWENVDSTS